MKKVNEKALVKALLRADNHYQNAASEIVSAMAEIEKVIRVLEMDTPKEK